MKVVIINIVVILILIVGGGAAFYYYNQSVNYVSTNNSRVDGQLVTIAAAATGEVTNWTGSVGKGYKAGDVIGTITGAAAKVDITVPVDSTIVQESVVPNTFVAPGTPLARSFDFNHLWITANVDETRINDVKPGQLVDVYIDAFPGNTLTGKVDQIGLTTAATFSLLPTSNNTANYTKVKQVIPVVITLDGYKGLAIVPGMNASVRIHI